MGIRLQFSQKLLVVWCGFNSYKIYVFRPAFDDDLQLLFFGGFMAQHGSTTLTSSTFHVDFFPCSPDTSRLRKRLKNGTVISVKAWSALGASGGLRWHRNNYGLKPPTWRSPKSWGSPQIIHLFVMFHEINHSLNPGYPHDYGHLHIVVFLLVCFLNLAFGLPMSRGLIMGFNQWSTKVGRNYKTLVNHATKMTYMALSKKMVAPQKSLVKKSQCWGNIHRIPINIWRVVWNIFYFP